MSATLPDGPNVVEQQLLRLRYQELVRSGQPLPPISDTGFKVFSQTDEDGVLWFLFSVIGTTNKACVEMCAGDGTECNTANLILHHGWHGLLFDGAPASVEKGRRFY